MNNYDFKNIDFVRAKYNEYLICDDWLTKDGMSVDHKILVPSIHTGIKEVKNMLKDLMILLSSSSGTKTLFGGYARDMMGASISEAIMLTLIKLHVDMKRYDDFKNLSKQEQEYKQLSSNEKASMLISLAKQGAFDNSY